MTFYAVCNSNGLISVALKADSRGRAILELREAVANSLHVDWLAEGLTDLEEACGYCCDEMSFVEAIAACSSKGASLVWGADDSGYHWAIWEHNAQAVPDCDQEAVTLRGSDLPSAINALKKLTHVQALDAANAGKSIVMCDRDATGHLFVRNACWLDEHGRLVMSHPTDRTGTIVAPFDGTYELLFEDD